MNKKPRIAVCETGKPQERYYESLRKEGAEAVQLHTLCDISAFDGLVLPGGADIDPARYGQEINGSVGIDDELDALQFAVLDAFIKAKKPVLGICRGHQCIAVYFGIPLIQHLNVSARHAKGENDEWDKYHAVRSVPGTPAAYLYGAEFTVNSSHHQAAAHDGNGLITMAVSDDGVIEGFVHETLPVFSVQWHPERSHLSPSGIVQADGADIFRAFLKDLLHDGKHDE